MKTEQFRPSAAFFGTLVGVTAAGPMAVQLYIPSVPAIIKDFEISLETAQLAFSVSLITMAISMLFYGLLADRFGRRPVLLSGMLVFLTGSIIAAVSNEIGTLIAGRVLQSVGGAGGLVISRAIVRDIYGPERAARVLGTLITVFIAAPMIAVVLGGILTDIFGWRSIFYLTILLGILVIIMIFRYLPSAKQEVTELSNLYSMVLAYFTLLRSPVFLGFAFQGAFAPGAFMAFMAVGPYLMVHELMRPATEFGVLFGVVTLIFMLANFVGGRLSGFLGIERTVMLGALVAVVGSVVGLSLYTTLGLTIFLMFSVQTVSSIGNGLGMPSSQVGALNVNPKLSATASGAAAFVQTIIGATFAQTVASAPFDIGFSLFLATLIAALGSLTFASIPLIIKLRHQHETSR